MPPHKLLQALIQAKGHKVKGCMKGPTDPAGAHLVPWTPILIGDFAAGPAGAARGALVAGARHHSRGPGRPAALHLLPAVVAHRQAPPKGPSAVRYHICAGGFVQQSLLLGWSGPCYVHEGGCCFVVLHRQHQALLGRCMFRPDAAADALVHRQSANWLSTLTLPLELQGTWLCWSR